MPTRLVNFVVDAADPPALARFWADLLGWPTTFAEDGEIDVTAPEEDGWDMDLVFVPAPNPKLGKNRVHLDLSSVSPTDQDATVRRALGLGARPVDLGQGDVPWVVLADPEGNEFCVLEPRPEYADTGAIAAIVVDALDPSAQATFWAAATGHRIIRDEPAFASLHAPDRHGPWLEFLRTTDPKLTKNPLHLDLAPHLDEDQHTEAARLQSLGATLADVGQGDVPWVVLTDPEGNEFCILTPR
ncbi:VOC family protein [Actinokineospora cianjurensis]|uniref:Putative enzyme related to lactoylglutathione lyase n=1 Tax=Actinokineospora cianjurensis TaxID=585224 RepID=A0A421BAP0_9PSEU|nr:VOC family protein [Actinokineospora cianjurensis]RLK61521.1 putative enzyme related to lactoylglutathione lyase [Actinokineospora cianjurensis]